MSIFSNLKLRTKLILAFSMTIIIMVFTGTFGLMNLKKVSDATSEIYMDGVKPYSEISRISNSIKSLRIDVFRSLAESDAEKNLAVKKTLSDRMLEIEKQIIGAQTNFSSKTKEQSETDLGGQWKELMASYINILSMVADFETEDALISLTTDNKEKSDRFDSAVENLQSNLEGQVKQRFVESQAIEQQTTMITAGTLIGGSVLSLLFVFFLSRSITRPIGTIVRTISKMQQGNLVVRTQLSRKDEIGQMGIAMDNFAENLEGLVNNIRASAGEVSQLSVTLTDISNVLATSSEENAAQANSLSSAAEQMDSNVTSVATAVEQMSAITKEITGTVTKSSAVAQSAADRSEKAAAVVRSLSASSDAIGKITELIGSIASQTNILALNATIEAARAGDAGKGFAVVANEVKELAKETSNATDDIVSQIAEMQNNAKDAVQAFDEISAVMAEVNSHAATVSAAIEEQSSTMSEISRSMNEAAGGVKAIVSNVSGVAQSATENSNKSTETKDAADLLTNVSSKQVQLVALFKTGDSSNEEAEDRGQPDDSQAVPDNRLHTAQQDPEKLLL